MIPVDPLLPSPPASNDRTFASAVAICSAIMAITAAGELMMGRHLLCACGVVRFWVGDIHGAELSQQLADWYSFSHVIHGFVLYALWRWLMPRRSVSVRLIGAVVIEAGWELIENSPFVIARYRQTAAAGYVGDSVLNSMSDISFAVIGFALAARLPVRWIVAAAVVMELFVGYRIHDNLLLNVIMLAHPFAAIRRWQMSV